ncbi:NRPS-like enzyme [Penicillium sp. IBT 16267x]|nr:NRPS-like enzyme [Penicillium sp. IBT 16267x]
MIVVWGHYIIIIPLIYFSAVVPAKLTVIHLYLNIFTSKKLRMICFIVTAIILGNWFGTTVAGFLACRPLSYFWTMKGTCVNTNAFFRWSGLANVFTDFIMLLLPIPMVWQLQASVRLKMGIAITFLLGSIGLISSILRFYYFFVTNAEVDGTWTAAQFVLWCVIESGTYQVAACFPLYRPLVRFLGQKLHLATTRGESNVESVTDMNGSNSRNSRALHFIMAISCTSDFDPSTQLIPNLVDHYAKIKPHALYAEYPVNPMSYEDGYRQIAYKAFANAINGVAHWLTESLGPGKREPGNEEVLAYLGPNDLRYPALILGAVKAGFCMFLPSPRNSLAAHQALLKKLNCTTLLVPAPRPPFVTAIIDALPLKVVEVPSLDTLLATEHPFFKYSKTYPEAGNDRLVVLHTSGSTGIPKPITWTHESAVKHMHMQRLGSPAGSTGQDSKGFGKRMYLTLPPFHAAGIGHILFITIPVDVTLIMPTASGPPTAVGLVAARKQTPFEWAVVVPSIVLELAQDPELLDYCSTHLEYIIYCGGDLPQAIGNTVAAKVQLMNGYGASELGILNVVHSPDRNPLTDWRYLNFHPELGMEFRHVSGEEYEAVLVRSPDREAHQFPFSIQAFAGQQEYHTNDLMVRHPTKAGLWRPSARVDDVIVFLNGEKTNPVSMEQHIVACNSEVTGCLVAGAQRFQAALIIERGGKLTESRDAIIEELWPSIEQANSSAPAHARIAKSHILFTSPQKPMLRAGKGTVQRAGTLALYAQELEDLYASVDTVSQLVGPGGVDDTAQVTKFIRTSILAITGWNPDKLTDTKNWFNLGLDSLQAITATRVLKQGLSLATLTPNVIYSHPTVAGLTHALCNLHQNLEESTEVKNQGLIQERDQLLQQLIGQIDIPKAQWPTQVTSTAQTVILTGSTGHLGTYMLDALLKSPGVKHVYCLNRDDRACDRQQERGTAYGLSPLAKAQGRVTFWKADLSQADLGLQPEQLQELQQSATLVIHNAWPVNFNLSLASFKPHLLGVVNLINFSGQSTYSPRLFFISSISSTFGHHTDTGLTPESIVTTTTPAPNGYANSKYVAEHLLAHAVQQSSGNPASTHIGQVAVARVGQVAGPIRSRGLWNKTEWFPSLVLSSLHLEALPDTIGLALDRIDWVPVDLLADILVDLALLERSSASNFYHPVNLHPQSWKDIRSVVADTLGKASGKILDTIPEREWLLRVRRDVELASQAGEKELQLQLSKNPAAKLLEFFETAMAQTTLENVLDAQGTAQVSEKLREVDAVKPEWIQEWVQEWLQ